MLTVKGFFRDGVVELPETVRDHPPGPVLVTFLDEKEMKDTSGLVQFLEGKQRSLDSTVITREQVEKRNEEKKSAE